MPTIAVFDSGVGGLSVLKALQATIPEGDFVYLADSGYAPYGERGDAWVDGRCQEITAWLTQRFALDALVVACNTATAAAIDRMRAAHPHLPIVGVEPGLKPALALTHSGHIGVMATRGTLNSQRFGQLLSKVGSHAPQAPHTVQWHVRACNGLADAIERNDNERIEALCSEHCTALMAQAEAAGGRLDVVVLGCTHYPFVRHIIAKALGAEVALVDTGEAVARHTRWRLGPSAMPQAVASLSAATQTLLLSTGQPENLSEAAQRWLTPTAAQARSADIPCQL
jgi:glutamate racemase